MTTPQEEARQKEINDLAWKACDTFRGVVDPTEYKNYILTILFLKYLTDVWMDRRDEHARQFPDDPEMVGRRLARELFILPINSGYYALYENRDKANIGELINIALHDLEEANKGKLSGIFRNIDFNSEANLGKTRDRNRRLKALLEDFHDPRLDLRPSRIGSLDVIGNVYEYLIGRFASDAGKKGGEFYTPPEVATLLARLVRPQSGNIICDPTCGSGSLLIKVSAEIPRDEHGVRNCALHGQESNGSTWALSRMNMFLHGAADAQLEWGDTLNEPRLLDDKGQLRRYDIVVANPPFSLDKWGQENAAADRHNRFRRGIPPKSRADFAFISHMIAIAREGSGRVGVVVPHGVLFRGGQEGVIRRALIEENLLDAVIGLPEKLFYGTGIPAAILLFDKGRAARTEVLFVDASKSFVEGTNQNKLGDADITRILDVVARRATQEKFSRLVPAAELRENEFNLNIPRYVDTREAEQEVDLPAVQARLRDNAVKLDAVRSRLDAHLRSLGLDA